MTTERPEPPLVGDEREMLRTFLDFHRATLAMKCDGLSDEDLRRAASPPSTLSLLGLVRHMAEVERTWFRRVIGAEDVPLVFDRFYRVAGPVRPPGGSGIGLTIARGIARAHGGEVSASSPGPGHGSKFRLALPLADAGPGHA